MKGLLYVDDMGINHFLLEIHICEAIYFNNYTVNTLSAILSYVTVTCQLVLVSRQVQ